MSQRSPVRSFHKHHLVIVYLDLSHLFATLFVFPLFPFAFLPLLRYNSIVIPILYPVLLGLAHTQIASRLSVPRIQEATAHLCATL